MPQLLTGLQGPAHKYNDTASASFIPLGKYGAQSL